jgi:hypothetical protein
LPKTFTVELDGRFYVWNGRSWFAAKTYQAPPLALASRLNELLASVLAVEDAEIKDFHGLLQIAQPPETRLSTSGPRWPRSGRSRFSRPASRHSLS